MFMTQYTESWTAVDLIAERIRALGHPAPGSYAAFSSLASVREETGVPSAKNMIKILVKDHERVAKTARAVLPVAEKANDQPTIDLITQRLQWHEKTAWMLRSLLEK